MKSYDIYASGEYNCPTESETENLSEPRSQSLSECTLVVVVEGRDSAQR
jgi:hypothetical protein